MAFNLFTSLRPVLGNPNVPLLARRKASRLTLELSDCDLPAFMQIAKQFKADRFAYAVTPNTDHLIRYCQDSSFRELYDTADFVLFDSRFLALIIRLVSGLRLPTCPGSDVTENLFADVVNPHDKVVVIGGRESQAQMLADRYGLRELRHHDPPMGFIRDPVAVEACLQFIERQSPFRFCILAVGSPQQEMLARALMKRGQARGMALCVGASINFLTAVERRAPKWMQEASIEWIYRLLRNPGRMAKRYLVRGPLIFLLLPRLKFLLRAPGTATATEPCATPAVDSQSLPVAGS